MDAKSCVRRGDFTFHDQNNQMFAQLLNNYMHLQSFFATL